MLMLQAMMTNLDGSYFFFFLFFQEEDGIRDVAVTGVQTCALPISPNAPGDRNACARPTRRPNPRPQVVLYGRIHSSPLAPSSRITGTPNNSMEPTRPA